jgi:hypothetical protein
MKQLSIWTATLAIGTGLATGAWAQHGGVHGGAGHEPHELATDHGPHAPSGGTNFVNRLSNNTNLANRLQPLLPAGETLQAAAAGFKNQGQFIAALHVSHNLNLPFDQLKAEMTGSERDSLGQAIHDLRPDLTSKLVKNNVRLAENQTKTDLEESKELRDAASN